MKVVTRVIHIVSRVAWLALVIHIFVVALIAQESSDWKNYSTSNHELTLQMPTKLTIVNEDDDLALYGYVGDVSLEVSRKNVDHPKDYVKKIDFLNSDKTNVKTFDSGGFLVRQLVFDKTEDYTIDLYIASPKTYYHVSAKAKTKSDVSLNRFLNSIQLAGELLFENTNPAIANTVATEVIERLKSSPTVKVALEKKCTENVKYGYQTKNLGNQGQVLSNQKNSGIIYSRHLVVLRKVKAHNPNNVIMGRKVLLRVLFKADGCVGGIIVVEGGKDNVTLEAIKAAVQIKFLPMEIAGKPSDVWKLVEYSF